MSERGDLAMLSMRAAEPIGGTGQRAAFDAGIFADLPETPAHTLSARVGSLLCSDYLLNVLIDR
jgi:hypothetical protein